MAVVTGTGYVTPMGAQAVASWIYDKLRSGAFVLGVYNGTQKIKTLSITVELVGSQVIVHAKDSSADEYDFNKVTIETTAGVSYFEDIFDLEHKSSASTMEVDWVLPVLQSASALGGASARIPV